MKPFPPINGPVTIYYMLDDDENTERMLEFIARSEKGSSSPYTPMQKTLEVGQNAPD